MHQLSSSDESSATNVAVPSPARALSPRATELQLWLTALRAALPAYLLSHTLFALLTYLAPLFMLPNFSPLVLPLSSLVHNWHHWDAAHYTTIAQTGYTQWWQTAFFPLFPLLEHLGAPAALGSPHVAGLVIANLAGLTMLTVFYRLLAEDFSAALARRVLLYFALFPSAFFLAAAYPESLFLLWSLLCFYGLRHQRWWLAGLCGLLAALTRPAGLLLVVLFVYEYGSRCGWQLLRLRLSALAAGLIPLGTGLFALYCLLRFGDPLAFSHAQARWNRYLELPGLSVLKTILSFFKFHFVSFDAIHNAFDLVCVLFIVLLVILCWVGPWRLPAERRGYALYALLFCLFGLLWPTRSGAPLNAFPRYLLEAAPAFVVLGLLMEDTSGRWSRLRSVLGYYPIYATALLSFALLQFLTGRWMV
ncbi:mannosyltransferase family protein [Thermogemmatispora tikiterensis]|uniref:Glycosyltransferase RgtA/B/C/D-like domain-containing protein n=1 Tax=Thermogemmatispora tikiterensis TaxID=1825093 RepID=A0A328VK78_9CHLR|nr:mannosyltransferase family protein [Thermogemmatispora tikiterensis]RAQ97509.1 hypothetical protein A4R35_18375 [Thermogemmatispora tikiterensis]